MISKNKQKGPIARLTVGEANILIKNGYTDEDLKSRFGSSWREVQRMLENFKRNSRINMGESNAWVAQWHAVTPKPPKTCLFSWDDLISMIEDNGKKIPDHFFIEWGQAIATAVREGKAGAIHALATYVTKLQKVRPVSHQLGTKAPWPRSPREMPLPTLKKDKRTAKLTQAYRELVHSGESIDTSKVWERAGLKEAAKGKKYTEAFQVPGLSAIKRTKRGKKTAAPATPKARNKG